MIQKLMGYQSSDTKVHSTLDDAKKAELRILFHSVDGDDNKTQAAWTVSEIADAIHGNADKIIDILTTTATSKPRGRKINGATRKPRTPKPAAAPMFLEPPKEGAA